MRPQDSGYTNKNKDVFPGEAFADLKVASLQAQRDDAHCSPSSRHLGMAFWLLKWAIGWGGGKADVPMEML